jgi:hypothetical protein
MGEQAEPVWRELLLWHDRRIRMTMASALRGAGVSGDPWEELLEWASPGVAATGTSLHPNSSLEADPQKTVGWKLLLEEDAQGTASVDTSVARTGHNSLKLEKTNGAGYLSLRSTQPIILPEGDAVLTFRLHYRCDNADLTSVLMPCFEDLDGHLWYANESGRLAGATRQSQTFLRNTPPGVWATRLITLDPKRDYRRREPGPRAVYLRVMLYGNPLTVWLDDIDFPAPERQFAMAAPTECSERLPREEWEAGMKGHLPLSATVRSRHEHCQVAVDDNPVPPAFYFPVAPAFGDYRSFATRGRVPFQVVNLPLEGRGVGDGLSQEGAGQLRPMWSRADNVTPDVDGAVRTVEEAARRAPDSPIIIGFHVAWPRDYVDTYPQTAWLNEDGERAYGNHLYHMGYARSLPNDSVWWWPSPYSEKALDDAATVLANCITRFREEPWGRHIAGVFVSGGHDGQFFVRDRDYGQEGQKRWRQWLMDEYGSAEKLAEAWGNERVDINRAPVPMRPLSGAGGVTVSPMFYDPASDRHQADYSRFRHAQMWHIRERLLGAAKRAAGKSIIGMTWHMGGGSDGGFRTVFRSQAIDAVVMQPLYQYRAPGYVSVFDAVFGSAGLHGKLMVREMDTRSWLRETYGHEIMSAKISTPMDIRDLRGLFRKEIGQSIAQHSGWWYYDISSNAFRHPDIMDEVAAASRTATALSTQNDDFQPDVVLVYSDRTPLWERITHYGSRSLVHWMLDVQEQAVLASGVPVARYHLSDIMAHPGLQDRRVYVFMNTTFLTKEERSFIDTVLKRDGRFLVWHYAPGYLSDDGISVDGISQLTGVQTDTSRTLRRQQPMAVASADRLSAGLSPLQGRGDAFRFTFISWNESPHAYEAQRFDIVDSDATALARYAEGGTKAVAVKRFNDWTSVYVAAIAGLSPELLNNIAGAAGAFAASRPGLWVEMTGSFASIHVLQSGRYTLRLPGPRNVADAFTYLSLGRGVSEVALELDAQDSRWMLLETVSQETPDFPAAPADAAPAPVPANPGETE